MTNIKLSAAQKRVMTWIGKGHAGRPSHGFAINVNGKRICNVDTMTALARMGLVKQDDQKQWVATKDGRELTNLLCL